MGSSKRLDAVWQDRIAQIIEGLKYGYVQFTIHDGRIVQIDRCERHRFDSSSVPATNADSRVNRK